MLDQKKIIEIAAQAGKVILPYYEGNKKLGTQTKGDDSPVTCADLAANDFIMKELNNSFPNIKIVSEENSEISNLNAAQENEYFMIDPLDGTSGFIKNSDEFTVNIAYIKNSRPFFGAIYLPATDIMYWGSTESKQAYKIADYCGNQNITKIKSQNYNQDWKIICTKREPEKSAILSDLKERNITIGELISIGSSYKFCLIAEGFAHLYPRRASINAWDVAAGDAIVHAANGSMTDLDSNKLVYNFKQNFKLPFFEVKVTT